MTGSDYHNTALSEADAYSIQGCVEEARNVCLDILLEDPNSPMASHARAKLASTFENPQQAHEFWSHVKVVKGSSAEVSLQLSSIHKQLLQFTDANREFADYLFIESERLDSRNTRLKAANIPLPVSVKFPAYKYRHVAIGGVSYCGSTVLANILGTFSGIENIGESHWLVNKRDTGSGRDIDFKHDSDDVVNHCFACGNCCEYFTRKFRKTLQDDPTDWYYKISDRLNTQFLVSSDKNYKKLINLDPQLRMDTVVLFKSPLQAWYSNFRKHDMKSGMNPVTDVEEYLNTWTNSYQVFLDQFNNTGQKLFLSFDHFCTNPKFHLDRLCDVLDIPSYIELPDPQIITKGIECQHYFGGNNIVNGVLKQRNSEITIYPLPDVDLPQAHIDAIMCNTKAQKVFRQMMDLYQRDFAVVDGRVVDAINQLFKDPFCAQDRVNYRKQIYLKAAEDSERNLQARVLKLANSGVSHRQVFVTQVLLDLIDMPGFRQIQKEYLTIDSVKMHEDEIKKLDLDYFFSANYSLAENIGLTGSTGYRVLDIGAGAGYFSLVCRLLGHNVTSTDIDRSSSDNPGKLHLFDALKQLFKLDRLVHRVQPFTPLPDFGEKFNVVTVLNTKCIVEDARTNWGTSEWRFFLDDLADNQILAGGSLFIGLSTSVMGSQDEPLHDEILEYFVKCGATVNHQINTVEFLEFGRHSLDQ